MTAKIVFTMGLPGSGKSTIVATLYDGYERIDPDQLKLEHPDYDPKHPEATHAWSMKQAEGRFNEALACATGYWVVDGTGVNAERMIRRIVQAQAAGFKTTLLYVRVTLNTAIARNAARERAVSEEIIKGKALDIATSFELVSARVDEVIVIDNDSVRV